MKKVLVLCNDFPPLNSIGAQRPYSWFLYLPEHSLHVTVVTKSWLAKSEMPQHVQAATAKSVETTKSTVLIRVPDENSPVALFIKQFGYQKLSTLRKFLVFLEQLLKWIWAWWDKNRSIYVAAAELLSKEKFDVVITTGEPFILFKYGSKLKKQFAFKWIADYRDGWFHNHVSSVSKNPLKLLVRQWEKFLEKKYYAIIFRLVIIIFYYCYYN